MAGKWVASGLAALLAPSAAQADWQYTSWGMTPDQVRAAATFPLSERPARPPERDHLPRPLGGRFTGFGRDFDLTLRFRDGLLNLVVLVPDRCEGLIDKLKRAYGRRPTEEARGGRPTWFWRDRRHGNLVTLIGDGPRCTLFYEALSESRASEPA